jgi:hypothetical protein
MGDRFEGEAAGARTEAATTTAIAKAHVMRPQR